MHQIFLCVRLAFKNASEQLLGTATITITMITKKKVETGKSVLTHAGVCGLSTSDHLCILCALPRHTIVCAHFNSLLFFLCTRFVIIVLYNYFQFVAVESSPSIAISLG